MANVRLYEFIGVNREELIRRCQAKVVTRSAVEDGSDGSDGSGVQTVQGFRRFRGSGGSGGSGDKMTQGDHGVPLFLDQLVEELRHGPSNTNEINAAITAFEVIQTGTVGVGGTTGALISRSLAGMRALVDRPAESAQPAKATANPKLVNRKLEPAFADCTAHDDIEPLTPSDSDTVDPCRQTDGA